MDAIAVSVNINCYWWHSPVRKYSPNTHLSKVSGGSA